MPLLLFFGKTSVIRCHPNHVKLADPWAVDTIVASYYGSLSKNNVNYKSVVRMAEWSAALDLQVNVLVASLSISDLQMWAWVRFPLWAKGLHVDSIFFYPLRKMFFNKLSLI